MTESDIDLASRQCYWEIYNFLDSEENVPCMEANKIATEVQNLVQARLTEFFK